jgi:hypothetical protein
VITVGPYTFTEHDARRTLASFDRMWQQLADRRDAAVLEPLRPSLNGDVAHDLPLAWDALLAAGPALRAAGQLPARSEGVVAALHLGNGGVPKQPVERVEIGFSGVVGDRQAHRQHHGRPFQALCLWSTEVIDAFRSDGHPLAPGLAGENITLSGLSWPELRPGVRLGIGSVLCEVSAYAVPCNQNVGWFLGGDFQLMHHDRGPVSRLYATVLVPGAIDVGDPAILEP